MSRKRKGGRPVGRGRLGVCIMTGRFAESLVSLVPWMINRVSLQEQSCGKDGTDFATRCGACYDGGKPLR